MNAKHLLSIPMILLVLLPGCTRQDRTAFEEIGRLITPMGVFPVGTNPTSVTAGDFDGDGLTDLLTTNISSDSLSLLIGNGDGTFREKTTLKLGNMPRAAVASDYDGDGLVDLALANAGSKEVAILLGNGDGTFRTGESYSTPGSRQLTAARHWLRQPGGFQPGRTDRPRRRL